MATNRSTRADSVAADDLEIFWILDDLAAAAQTALMVFGVTATRDGPDIYWTRGGGYEAEKALRSALVAAEAEILWMRGL